MERYYNTVYVPCWQHLTAIYVKANACSAYSKTENLKRVKKLGMGHRITGNRLGKKEHNSDSVAAEEEDMLRNKEALGRDTQTQPDSVLLYKDGKHGCQEHKQIRVSEKYARSATECIEWVEQPTKTRKVD